LIGGHLITSGRKLLAHPFTDADGCRAVSAAYYALFSGLSQYVADVLLNDPNFDRANYQAFRSLAHGNVCDRCRDTRDGNRAFPETIRNFADVFIDLYEQRENADYCPRTKFNLSKATDYLDQAEEALNQLHSAPTGHGRAFALFVLLKQNKWLKRKRVNDPK